MKEIPDIKYIAFDGTEFHDKERCINYEKSKYNTQIINYFKCYMTDKEYDSISSIVFKKDELINLDVVFNHNFNKDVYIPLEDIFITSECYRITTKEEYDKFIKIMKDEHKEQILYISEYSNNPFNVFYIIDYIESPIDKSRYFIIDFNTLNKKLKDTINNIDELKKRMHNSNKNK